MAEPNDLARQLRQRLESLQAAGIDWLPRNGLTLSAVPITTASKSTAPMVSTMPKPRPASPPVTVALPETPRPINKISLPTTLPELAEVIKTCKLCLELAKTRTQTVFGVGPMNPELCFVGEAPGADEDAQGEPFVGRAGQLLDKIIVAMGYQRSQVYICNTLKCRPPGNATPTPTQCTNCRPFFERQLDLVKPKYICCLGTVAAQNVLTTDATIGRLRGKLHDFRGIPVLATYHPAYLLRNPAAKKDVWDDMKFLLAKMGRPVPETKS